MTPNTKNIRNSSITTHTGHGKSVLSNRIVQICSGPSDREMAVQVPDSMDLEHKCGITIKARSVTPDYKANGGKTYQLNSIGTPSHADFSYEVLRSLVTYEDVLLVADVGQSVEAQTLTDCYTAMEVDLKVISVLNEIDLPTADPEHVADKTEDIVSIDTHDAVRYSAKTGVDIPNVLGRLVCNIPPPEGDPDAPLQVLIIDSWFDDYLGVASLVRIENGTMRGGDKIRMMGTGQVYNVDRLSIFIPKQVDRTELKYGEVGQLVYAIRDILDISMDDTLTTARNPVDKASPGFKKAKPQVYAGLFPMNSNDYEDLRNALSELSPDGTSLFYELKSSTTLDFDFRRGFLGLLHMEVIQERLRHGYDPDLTITAPTVVCEAETTSREVTYVSNPSKLPPLNNTQELREPTAERHMLLLQEFLGNMITLCIEERGVQTNMIYHDEQVALTYEIPMTEVVLDFFGRLRSASHNYASLDYNFKRFQVSNIVRVDALINGKHVDTLALATYNDNIPYRDCELVEKIKGLVPYQQFDTAIQTAIDNHIIVYSTAKRPRKNVLAKCYGGDISCKKKLLQKQGGGKKYMEQVGNIELPQKTFLAILHVDKGGR